MPGQDSEIANLVGVIRDACEHELATGKELKKFQSRLGTGDQEANEMAVAWSNAYADRMRATHPTKMLRILDYYAND